MILLIAYLVGCVLAYLLIKYNMKAQNNIRWTKRRRTFTLFISVFSWITVLVGVVNVVMDYANDEEASW